MRDTTGSGRARPVALPTLAGALLAATLAVTTAGAAVAQTDAQRLKLLEQTVKELLERDEARERKMKALEGELKRLRGGRGLTTVAPGGKPAMDDGDHEGHDHGKKPAAEMKDGHDHDHGDKAGEDAAMHADDHAAEAWSARVGDGVLRLSRIGLDADFAMGAGSEHTEELFGGHHDPGGTGFSLQSADLSIAGSYDPYFDAFFNVAFTFDAEGETGLEIEEAWARTKWIGQKSLRLKAGQFLTAFGAVNRTHLHDWAWQTQPVIATRVFGGDGARGLGVEAEAPLSSAGGAWQSKLFLSMQNRRSLHLHDHGAEEEGHEAHEDEDEDAHEEEGGEHEEHEAHGDEDGAGVDGLEDFAYAIRLENRLKLSPRSSLTFGGSAMFEPNPNGNGTRVSIFGGDFRVTHRLPSKDRLVLSAEFMHRNSKMAVEHHEEEEEEEGHEENGEEHEEHGAELVGLRDYGFYVQGMYYGKDGWGLGLRYEYAASRGGDAETRASDPMRGKRVRISPLLFWQFSELGRLKLQYNYDRADFLEDRIAHSLYLSASWSFGLGAPDHAGHAH